MKKIQFYIVLVMGMFFSLSCSTVKFAYNQADWLIVRGVTKAICLNDEQEEKLEQEVDNLLAWHRKNELPRYVAQMRIIADSLEKGVLDRTTFDNAEVFLKETQKRTISAVRPFALELAMTMSPEQLDCSCKRYEEKREDREEDLNLPLSEYKEKRTKAIRKQMKRWLGSVTDEQEKMIVTMISPQSDAKKNDAISLKKRKMIHEILKGQNSDEKRAKIEALFANFEAGLTADEVAFRKQLGEKFKENLWKFSQTLTAEQRKELAKTLRGYAEDLEELSKE